VLSGFRKDGQAEQRNGTEEPEHLYSVLTTVIIHQLNENECQFKSEIYGQYLLLITESFGQHSHLQTIQNTYQILVVVNCSITFLKKGVRFHFYIQDNNP
jgi:hypothetical protein